MTAREIVGLIAGRHTKDVFVDECKDGATWFGSHLRLDAWAMARSWARPLISGYEVKVSRADWLRDQKVMDYMELCNCMWLVAPSGVVADGELPEGVGMLIVNSKGTGLFVKRKAVHRKIEPPSDMLKYILMSRARIISPQEHRGLTGRPPFQEYVEGRAKMEEIGYAVSKRLREETLSRVQKAEAIAQEAVCRADALGRAAKTLNELGFGSGVPGDFAIRARIAASADKRRTAIDGLEDAGREITRVLEILRGEDQPRDTKEE